MKRILFLSLLCLSSIATFGQGAHDFCITEVYIAQDGEKDGYLDEYGDASSWIEIENTSYTTHDIRNCYLTNNEEVLKEMPAPEREKLMSVIMSGDERTNLKGKQRITFFADGKNKNGKRPRGVLHTNFQLKKTDGDSIFIALYDGNAVDMLDCVKVPTNLEPGSSWALIDNKWQSVPRDQITPNSPNSFTGNTDKIKEWKEKDPHGLAMTLLSMGIVFGCLLLLFVFFHLFGWIINKMNRAAKYKAIKTLREQANKVVIIAKEGIESKGIPTENYVAAISLAMHEYLGNLHDIESGVITIQRRSSGWDNKDHTLRHQESHFVPTN